MFSKKTTVFGVSAFLLACLAVAWHLYPAVAVTLNLAYPDSHIVYDRGEPVPYKYEGVGYTAYLHKNAALPVKKVIVFGHGVVVGGALDTRLQHFANALAREGYAVLMPHTVNKDLAATTHGFSCGEGQTRHLALEGAVAYASSRLTPGRKVSLMSISAGSREALQVASGPQAHKLSNLHLIGGYLDLEGLIVYNMTGLVSVDGQWRRPGPEGETRSQPGSPLRNWVLTGVLAGLPQTAYTETLHDRLMTNTPVTPDETVSWPKAYRDLAAFLSTKDPAVVKGAVSGLFAAVPTFSGMLSCWQIPDRWVAGVKASHISVLTNDLDVAIPAVESAKIAQAFNGRSSLHKTELLDHVGLITLADKWEQARRAWGLFTFVYTIVR